MTNVLSMIDIDYLMNAHRKYKMDVTLKRDRYGGIGLFSKRTIKANSIICFYRVTVFDENKYESITHNKYTFAIFNRNGIPYDHLVGDITPDSFCVPNNNIPFLGMFSNEPSQNQRINSYFDPNIKKNYKMYNRRGYKCGDQLVYNLRSLRDILPNEEILTYYGDDYERDYTISISQRDREDILIAMHNT